MAAAAAGAAQEKQLPPALLSFFVYNPRFGPREGEVSGAERGCARGQPAAGAAGGGRRAPGAAGGGRQVTLAAPRRAAPATLPSSCGITEPECQECAGSRVRRGPGSAARGLRVPDQCPCVE